MRGDALSLILLGIVLIFGIVAYFYFIGVEEVKVEYPYFPSVPKYSDINFSPISARVGKLPTEYLDLSKDYFEFPYSIKSSFLESSKVVVCPLLSYRTDSKMNNITGECQELTLGPNEERKGYIRINLENKEEIKNSTQLSIVVIVTYSSNIRGICDLYIDSGFPYCLVSKNSEVKISPLLTPNPIKLDRDDYFSIDLEIERYGRELVLDRVEAKALETKVIRKTRDKKIEELITIPGNCILDKEIKVEVLREFLRVCTLPQPKIEVRETMIEDATSQYFKLECRDLEKKFKICDILEKKGRTDLLKKIPIFLNVSFTASKIYSYKLFLTN